MNISGIIVLLLAGLCFVAHGAWTVEVAYDSDAVLMPAIALDSSGDPHITSCGAFNIAHSWKTGSVWSNESIWGSSYGGPYYPDIVVDDQDLCHVSFGKSGMLYYGVQLADGDGWFADIVLPPVNSMWTSIGLDSSGYPLISTYAFSPDDLLFIAWTGSGWVSEPVVTSGDQGDCNSLVVDQNNTPHISFCTYTPSAPAVSYAYRDEYGVWQIAIVDDTMGSDPKGTSLALDNQGHPHISYTADSELRYASWNGSSWTVETVDAIDTGLYEFDTSLALDQYGYPHIAHCMSAGDSLMYSVNQGGGWITESVCGLSSAMAGDPDLALDNLGRPHIAFTDNFDLMYAHNDEPSGVESEVAAVELLKARITPNPFYGTLSIDIDQPLPSGASIRILDVSGRLIRELDISSGGTGSTTFSWQPGSSIPDGTYLVVIDTGTQSVTERCILLR